MFSPTEQADRPPPPVGADPFPLTSSFAKIILVSLKSLWAEYKGNAIQLVLIPFKGSHQPLGAAGTKDAGLSSNLYIPLDARGSCLSGVDDTGGSRSDDYYTLRITNLSVEATEPDIKNLIGGFGPTARVLQRSTLAKPWAANWHEATMRSFLSHSHAACKAAGETYRFNGARQTL
ncbi:hypothetical protein DFJ73DRAFT_960113 [Zopfochytrium polystomum]|nr:hypothetical protein DFJ73DRAFT_960113 [Zopfochytrium polystomum]